MKFSEMPYARPDLDAVKQQFADLLARFKAAATYAEAHAIFLEEEKLNKHVDTLAQLASVRNTIDTRDKFYDEEMNFWNEATPQLQECQNAWSRAMLDSPFRADFTAEYGDLMFVNAEIADKAFSPDILDEMAQENKLTTEYGKLIASAQIPFEGGVYTLSQLSPFKNDPDDARRLAAWKAEGAWYKEHGAEFDGLYDQLVHLRDTMGKKLGYEGYTTLGYYRMGRNCYTKADVEKFRAAVVKYIVPLADSIYREQAGRLGKQYPMNAADNALMFRSGNPRPAGDADAILKQGKKFYEELSPETGVFFNKMLDDQLMDVLSTPGKAGGGAGQHREIGLAVAHRLVAEAGVLLRHEDPHEDVPVIGALGVLRKGHDAALVQLHRGVQRKEDGQHVRKAEAAVEAAAHSGEVAQLDAHDVAHRLPHCAFGVGGEALVQLELAQRHHRTDGKALLRLLDGIEAEARQVDGSAHIDVLHLEPDHAAEDTVLLFLVELPRLLETFGLFVFPNGHHFAVSSLFWPFAFILSQNPL